MLFIEMVWSLAIVFAVCDFGERRCGTFAEINDEYKQLRWYLFPCDVQQMLSFQIMVAQKPVELNVFGSSACGRITLKNVSKMLMYFFRF